MDRYLMTISLRRDGSSKFGALNRWGFFPQFLAHGRLMKKLL